MNRTLLEYYRCPEEFVNCLLRGTPSQQPGYFRLGVDAICYGRIACGEVIPQLSAVPNGSLHDALCDAQVHAGRVDLSFDAAEIVDNLRLERYCTESREQRGTRALANSLYYLARPLLPIGVRQHLQKAWLAGWRSKWFPHWPVDHTVEKIHQTLLSLCIQAADGDPIPFIWFWPHGLSSCVVITHDVETAQGQDFCFALMDLDESCGVKSSFQLIPERRYQLNTSLIERIRSRNFELNVHDLNHDGRLFANEAQFRTRAKQINRYRRVLGARGFRSAVLYRNLGWHDALEFDYEMSVPNVGHLDPQPGGCCTVMPYSVGHLVEIPLTTAQDYSLFHILGDYSTDLWRKQLYKIASSHGIATFNIHPDYIIESEARAIYAELLTHISSLNTTGQIWLALPGEVDRWWRNRMQMQLVCRSGEWKIEGPESEHARIAYATIRKGELKYSWENIYGPQVATRTIN